MELTREMILAMSAGREMDALVAERVMGIEVKRVSEDDAVYETSTRDWLFEGEYYFEADKQICELPYYNADIAAAWEVVEKIQFEIFPCYVEIYHDTCTWIVDFTDGEDRHIRASSDLSNPSICLAICRAALLATLEGK